MTDFIHKKIFIAAVSIIGFIFFLAASFFPTVIEESPSGYFIYTFGSLFGSWLTLYGFSGNETLFSLLTNNNGFSVFIPQMFYVLFMCGLISFILCFLPCWLATFLKKRNAKTEYKQ